MRTSLHFRPASLDHRVGSVIGPGSPARAERRPPERLASPPPTVTSTPSSSPCSFLPNDSSSPFPGSFSFPPSSPNSVPSVSLTHLLCPTCPSSPLPLVSFPVSSSELGPVTFRIPFSAPALLFLQHFTRHFHENQGGRSQKGGSGRMKSRGGNDEEDDFPEQTISL